MHRIPDKKGQHVSVLEPVDLFYSKCVRGARPAKYQAHYGAHINIFSCNYSSHLKLIHIGKINAKQRLVDARPAFFMVVPKSANVSCKGKRQNKGEMKGERTDGREYRKENTEKRKSNQKQG
jgi:hypothetical protein